MIRLMLPFIRSILQKRWNIRGRRHGEQYEAIHADLGMQSARSKRAARECSAMPVQNANGRRRRAERRMRSMWSLIRALVRLQSPRHDGSRATIRRRPAVSSQEASPYIGSFSL